MGDLAVQFCPTQLAVLSGALQIPSKLVSHSSSFSSQQLPDVLMTVMVPKSKRRARTEIMPLLSSRALHDRPYHKVQPDLGVAALGIISPNGSRKGGRGTGAEITQ